MFGDLQLSINMFERSLWIAYRCCFLFFRSFYGCRYVDVVLAVTNIDAFGKGMMTLQVGILSSYVLFT